MIRNIAIRVMLLTVCVACLFRQAAAQRTLPEWTRNAVCYEVFIRSFYDSDGDGVGDLRGLMQKLDYINDGDAASQSDLGATCIWLMPVAQSPSYHGYDVTNYYAVNKDYGTNEDFKQFMSEAHKRGIRVLVDLVLNHTSSEHPYFKDALLDPASPYRDWYIWSPTQRKMAGWEAPTWHRVRDRDEYYYGLFWSGMPDLNLANQAVKTEVEKVARFWVEEMGVDGFRLDAVGHLFEEGEQWKDAPATWPWLREYSAALKSIKPDVFTVGEVYDSLGSVLHYYPDQLDTYFAFEVADAVFDALRTGTPQKLIAAVERAQREIPNARWGMFLRNHDQTRTLTEFQGDVARNKLAATLLLTLPGIPFVYYGEEIGMTGAKQAGDPRLRTPMHWARKPAAGFTAGTPWEPLPADSFTANVEAQDGDPASLLNHHRRLIKLRTTHPALVAPAEFVPLTTSVPGALAYLRRTNGNAALVVANLGAAPLTRLTLSSPASAIGAGRYTVKPLIGGGSQGTLRVSSSGRIQNWTPVRVLAPFEGQVFELVPAR